MEDEKRKFGRLRIEEMEKASPLTCAMIDYMRPLSNTWTSLTPTYLFTRANLVAVALETHSSSAVPTTITELCLHYANIPPIRPHTFTLFRIRTACSLLHEMQVIMRLRWAHIGHYDGLAEKTIGEQQLWLSREMDPAFISAHIHTTLTHEDVLKHINAVLQRTHRPSLQNELKHDTTQQRHLVVMLQLPSLVELSNSAWRLLKRRALDLNMSYLFLPRHHREDNNILFGKWKKHNIEMRHNYWMDHVFYDCLEDMPPRHRKRVKDSSIAEVIPKRLWMWRKGQRGLLQLDFEDKAAFGVRGGNDETPRFQELFLAVGEAQRAWQHDKEVVVAAAAPLPPPPYVPMPDFLRLFL